MTFLQKKKKTFCFTATQKHYFSVFLFPFPLFSYCPFYLFQHKKRQNKKCTFFYRKPFFWYPDKLPNNYFRAPTHYLCFLDQQKKHYKTGENKQKKSWTDFQRNLGRISTQNPPNLGRIFNSTAYIYIYISLSLLLLLSLLILSIRWIYAISVSLFACLVAWICVSVCLSVCLSVCVSLCLCLSVSCSPGVSLLLLRDAEMTIKIVFERSSQKAGRRGGSKRGSTGDPPWNFIVGLRHRKNSINWKVAFLLSLLFPRKCSDNNFGQLPPLHPPRGRTRIRELLSERILAISAPPNYKEQP